MSYSSYEESPLTDLPPTPTNQIPGGWGEFVGIGVTAAIVIARELLRHKSSEKKGEDKAQEELIDFLKSEIEKRDTTINQLSNEIRLMRRSMDLSGEFAPPVALRKTGQNGYSKLSKSPNQPGLVRPPR